MPTAPSAKAATRHPSAARRNPTAAASSSADGLALEDDAIQRGHAVGGSVADAISAVQRGPRLLDRRTASSARTRPVAEPSSATVARPIGRASRNRTLETCPANSGDRPCRTPSAAALRIGDVHGPPPSRCSSRPETASSVSRIASKLSRCRFARQSRSIVVDRLRRRSSCAEQRCLLIRRSNA